MAVFRRLVFAALCAGLLSGVFAAVAHHIATVPLILEAETYEKSASRASAAAHDHSSAWEPENGAERTAYTLLADILTGFGFALLLGAGLTLCGGEAGWRQGLLWGLAGFATFTVAPSLGLPPQLPGSEAAPLFDRQLWWLGTAAATGCALALIAFTTRARWTILAAVLIVLPHLYGA
ncbi:MAG: cobalt transporter, partial [Alphaproteobacteria bacterium]